MTGYALVQKSGGSNSEESHGKETASEAQRCSGRLVGSGEYLLGVEERFE